MHLPSNPFGLRVLLKKAFNIPITASVIRN